MTHIEKIKYINSNNQSVSFGVDGLYMNEIALSWSYDVNSVNGMITSFTTGIKSFPLPASIIADSDLQANAIRDKLHDIFMYDILNSKKGRLVYRGYTLYCNITEVKNSNYTEWAAFGDVELNVTTDKPLWRKEKSVTFKSNGENADGLQGALDYEYDFEYDYGFIQNKMIFENDSFAESDFIMKIQGEIDTPSVFINNHMYSVDVILSAGDILEINSMEHTITHISAGGSVTNCFDLRNRDSYIFKKIDSGANTIYTSQRIDIILTCFDERGEPKWS